MASEEITISELELADEILADMVMAVDTTTDTKSVSLRQLKAWLGSSLPTGFIVPAIGKISDERFTLLDGKTLARDGSYQAFCNKVVQQVQAGNWLSCSASDYEDDLTNYGQCGKFVITNDYVRIPTITKFISATLTLAEIGRSYTETYSKITSAGSSTVIYTDKELIHAKFPYYMVVSTQGQTSEVEFDINQVYEDINLKADIAYVDAKMPTGTILPFGGSTAPSGFLICDGGTISRTTYAKLFSVIGEAYGAGDGSTTFNLPDYKNRTVFMRNDEAVGQLSNGSIPDHRHSISVKTGATGWSGGGALNGESYSGYASEDTSLFGSSLYSQTVNKVIPSHHSCVFIIKY